MAINMLNILLSCLYLIYGTDTIFYHIHAQNFVQEGEEHLHSISVSGFSLEDYNTNCGVDSELCARVADIILKDTNLNADPCVNPEQFYCGRWKNSTEIPPEDSSWSLSFDTIANSTRTIMKEILERKSCYEFRNEIEKSDTNGEIWDGVSTCFYESCLNTDAMDARKADPLFLSMFNSEKGDLSFLVLSNFTKESEMDFESKNHVMTNRMLEILKTVNHIFFWSVYVSRNTLDRSHEEVLHISDMSLSISYNFFDVKHRDYQLYFIENVEFMLKLFDRYFQEFDPEKFDVYRRMNPNSSISHNERAIRIFELEKSLQKMLLSPTEKRNVTKYTKSVTLGELRKRSPFFNIASLLKRLVTFAPTEKTFNDSTVLLIHRENYFEELSEYLQALDWSTIHDYILLKIIRSYASSLSKDWRDEMDRYSKKISGADPVPRWRRCRGLIPQWLLSRRYINEKFDQTTKNTVSNMINHMRHVFETEINTYSWMDDETRVEAKKKLSNMREKIAFPDWLVEDYESRFEKRYGSNLKILSIVNDFFGAQHYISEQSLIFQMSRLNQPSDRTDWAMHPHSVNAYFSPSLNEIAFMAAVLNEPAFFPIHENASRAEKAVAMALNYGAIGAVIAHEMTHGFDDSGKEYDSEGNLRNWWSEESKIKFDKKATCMKDQYGKYEVEVITDEHEDTPRVMKLAVRGDLTLGENIADNGGLQLAWKALQTELTEAEIKSTPLISYGVNMTISELFMFSWGHFWCELTRNHSLRRKIETDPHSPSRFRIAGPLANFETFSQTYNCTPGTLMNPLEKCKVW